MQYTVTCKVHTPRDLDNVNEVGQFITNDLALGIMVCSAMALAFNEVAHQVSCIYHGHSVTIMVYAPDEYPEPDIDDELFMEAVAHMFVEQTKLAFAVSVRD